jgi:hypothetical protein
MNSLLSFLRFGEREVEQQAAREGLVMREREFVEE